MNSPPACQGIFRQIRAGLAPALAVIFLSASGGAMAQGEPSAKFDIYEYRVEGNSLLAAGSIEQAVEAHMGEGRTLKDVESARAALEKRYHDAGYLTVLVSIPEQSVDSGVVDLQVTEATVSRLRVVGAQYHLPSMIKAQIEEVAEGKVPNFVALQKSLSDVNRAADIKVAPVLKPGKAPGTVEVQLDVDDQLPLHGNVELTNRQSPNTTAARLGASVRYDNLWQRGHSIGVTLQTSPQNTQETRVVALNYLWPMDHAGDALILYAVKSNSKFATLYNSPGLGLLGNTQIAGLRYALLLDGAPDYVQSMTVGVDHKDVQQTLNLSGLSADSPRVRYAPVSMSYRGVWVNDQPQPTTLDISAILGLRGLLGNSEAAFDAKRGGASANFTALRSTFQSFRDLGRWSLASKFDGQLASGPLLPSEQFVGGGADSVRGYLEGERSGDQAVRVSFELSGPAVKVQMLKTDWRLTALTFLDAARLLTKQAGAGQLAATSLAGAGAGLRMTGPRGIGLQLDAARALTNGDVAGGGTHKGDWRMHARLSMEF
jgi:hemolysin activation/secretion protein